MSRIWPNFPEESIIKTPEGLLMRLKAQFMDWAESPRREFDYPDHMAIFGRHSLIGDALDTDDPETYLEELLEDHVSKEALVAYVVEGRLKGWHAIMSPYGPCPLIYSDYGDGWYCRGNASEIADAIKDVADARDLSLVDKEISPETLCEMFSGDPLSGLWTVCQGDSWILFDEESGECTDAIDAVEDPEFVWDRCLRAVLESESDGPAKELLAESGICLKSVYLFDHSGLQLFLHPGPCRWDTSKVGWWWCASEGASQDELDAAAQGAIDEVNQWLSGNVWEAMAENMVTGEEHWSSWIVAGPNQSDEEACLEALDMEDVEPIPVMPAQVLLFG